jgi:hypothetical protein
MKLLAIIALVFISAESSTLTGSLIQLAVVALVALAIAANQTREVAQ